MSSEGLQRLQVWVEAKNLVVKIYQDVVDILPPEERYAMNQQLRRSAQSIPANIAEGYGRYYYQENIRFCYIARGSLEETLSYLILANELGFLSNDNFTHLKHECDKLVRMVNAYISYLKKSKHGEKEQNPRVVLKENDETYGTIEPFEPENQ
jgi:four helix bundle protein